MQDLGRRAGLRPAIAGRLTFVATALSVAVLSPAAAAASSAPRTFDTVMQKARAGEPVIAVDPKVPGLLLEEDSAAIKVSRDYGHRWSVVASGQVDPTVAIDSDGRFIAHSATGGYLPLDGFWITTSTDEGATWSAPVQTFQYPQIAKGTPIAWDRPWLGVDASTGTIYASIAVHTEQPGADLSDAATLVAFAGCHATLFTNALLSCGRRYVSASHDHGQSFGPAYPIDSADYPDTMTGGFSGIPVAADGTLATSYYASSAPRRQCPCLIFETSRDDGANWARHVVADASPAVPTGPLTVLDDNPSRAPYISPVISDSPSVELGPYIAADPTRSGHFAVMIQDPSRTRLLLFQTGDGGAHWSRPAVLGSGPKNTVDRPWLAFATGGALIAFWRSDHSQEGDPFTTWVAVEPAGEHRFAAPVEVSGGVSPGSDNLQDDASFVAGDDSNAYAVWGDMRAGNQIEPWFGSYRYAPAG